MTFEYLVIATRNAGKLREFAELFPHNGPRLLGLKDLGISPEVEETGNTFAENARLKALFYSRMTELPVLGDDSGLEVDVLGGKPGIFSARYAGPGATDADRIRKLLAEMESVGGGRGARFVCALALGHRGSVVMEVEGTCEGEIASEPHGTNGFGYDPIFLFPKLGRTYAELSSSEKNSWSHRANAVRLLLSRLRLEGTSDLRPLRGVD